MGFSKWLARAGTKSADSAKFNGKSTFGAKMVPKVTFFDFRVPKATCRAEARGCASRQWFLDVFRSPGAKMRLLRSKVTFSHFFDFGAQKSLLGEKVTLERKSDF